MEGLMAWGFSESILRHWQYRIRGTALAPGRDELFHQRAQREILIIKTMWAVWDSKKSISVEI